MSGSRDFGKIVNERRLALGYSLGQLANRMGTTATKVRAWERGDALPDEDMLDQLADELNMSVGVLRATLPEPDLDLDELTGEQTGAIAGAVFSDAADTAAVEVDEVDSEATATGPGEEVEEIEVAEGELEVPDEADEAEDPEATAAVAALDEGEGEDRAEPEAEDALAEPEEEDAAGDVEPGTEAEKEPDADSRLADLPTEAVPILPPVPVEPPGGLVAAPAMVATAPAPLRVDPNDLGVPESSGFFGPVERFMAVVFDPERNYLFWIRVVLILVVFFILFRILAWAVPEFFDVLKDILDTIESSPTEADPGTSFIDG